jgi:hypothetical protein
MAAITKVKLSGSTNGRGIKVAATATAGTTIHATGTSASVLDEVWLYATNQDTAAIALTIEAGGTSDPDDRITLTIPPKTGLTLVIPGHVYTGTGDAATTIAAYAGTANKVMIHGYVNRIS